MKLFVTLCVVVTLLPWIAVCNESRWGYTITEKLNGRFVIFSNYMYKDSYVTVHVVCGDNEDTPVQVVWTLEEVNCMEEMYRLPSKDVSSTIIDIIPWLAIKKSNVSNSNFLDQKYKAEKDSRVKYLRKLVQVSTVQEKTCGGRRILQFDDEADSDYYEVSIPRGELAKNITSTPLRVLSKDPFHAKKKTKERVVRVWRNGMYHFSLSISSKIKNATFSAGVIVQMKGDYGYLPANLWPQYPYFSIMSVAYLLVGTFWILLWARAHQHSAKIHLVIGALAAAGSAANTLQFIDLSSINTNGMSVTGLKWFSRLLQAVQDSHTQLLLMVVSTGYGITRPTLSKGLLFSSLILTYACLMLEMGSYVVLDDDLQLKNNHSRITLAVMIPYLLCLAVIGGWIMVASILTFHHLWARQHSRKIKIFSIFMAACIVAFLGSLIVICLSYGWFTSCRTNWEVEWFFQTYNKIQQLLLLLVLMWLWRPADQAQSYAFNPLSTDDGEDADVEDEGDGDDDDDEDDVGEINKNDVKFEKIEMDSLVRTTC